MRDPRKHPAQGDVLTRFGTTRKVIEVKTNDRGTITHVVYGHPTTAKIPPTEATISSWRGWAKEDASVVIQAEPPIPGNLNG